MDAAYPQIFARRGEKVVVLASGDPFFYGVGSVLARKIPPEEMLCLPAPSAFSLVAARLGWAQQDCALVTLHGRPLEKIIPHLQDGARIIALSWDGATPEKLAALLTQRGFGASRLTVCEHLGGPQERVRAQSGSRLFASLTSRRLTPWRSISSRIATPASCRVRPVCRMIFSNMTARSPNREFRALTLSALAPRRGELLWDIGAGSGSVAIEFMLADEANAAIAIEANSARAQRIKRNALALGTPGLRVVEGRAPDALAGLAAAAKNLRRRRRDRARRHRGGARSAFARRASGGQWRNAGDAKPARRASRRAWREFDPGADCAG